MIGGIHTLSRNFVVLGKKIIVSEVAADLVAQLAADLTAQLATVLLAAVQFAGPVGSQNEMAVVSGMLSTAFRLRYARAAFI